MAKHKIHWLTRHPHKWGEYAYAYCGKRLDRQHPIPLEEQTTSAWDEEGLKQVTCEKCLRLMKGRVMML